MGTVELVMAIEDEFRITIPNAIAPTLVRLGDLHAFVVRHYASAATPQSRRRCGSGSNVW